MAQKFIKTKPLISIYEFRTLAGKVKSFTSSSGKGYRVQKVENDVMYFLRLDANSKVEWSMDLNDVYRAYKELEDFETKNFKPYVPLTHSPARGLLLHLGLLK